MTTLVFIPSLNTKMGFIVLEKGIFLVIAATANEAPYVLDGLLYHQSSLVINDHYRKRLSNRTWSSLGYLCWACWLPIR